MKPGRITERAQREYLALLQEHLRARLEEMARDPRRALARVEGELRTDLESAESPVGTPSPDGLLTYRGSRPLRARYVVEGTTGDLVSVLPSHEGRRR